MNIGLKLVELNMVVHARDLNLIKRLFGHTQGEPTAKCMSCMMYLDQLDECDE